MKSYLIHPRQGSPVEGHFQVTYADNGLMHAIINQTDIAGEDLLYRAMAHIPLQERHIATLKARGVRVEEVPTDISFSAFWEKYDHKVSSKKKCEKIWNALPEADRQLAMAKLPSYNRWQAQQTTAKPYAETWLNQRRYENDYR